MYSVIFQRFISEVDQVNRIKKLQEIYYEAINAGDSATNELAAVEFANELMSYRSNGNIINMLLAVVD